MTTRRTTTGCRSRRGRLRWTSRPPTCAVGDRVLSDGRLAAIADLRYRPLG
ncbi:hypothetical protein ACFXJO_08545 [Streptomyces lavendulae]|uniref:hypothetical protein n=1 Tax=Streptomyces lavendulae TaxID=1914 RepID=UPI0036BC0B9B